MKAPQASCPDCGRLLSRGAVERHRGNKTCRVMGTRRRFAEAGRYPVEKRWEKPLREAGVLFSEDIATVTGARPVFGEGRGGPKWRGKREVATQLYVPHWAFIVITRLKDSAKLLKKCSAQGEEFCAALATRFLMGNTMSAIAHLETRGIRIRKNGEKLARSMP